MRRPWIVAKAEQEFDRHVTADDDGRDLAPERRRADQQEEMAQSWSGPGVPTLTDGMWKGLVWGALAGGALGALLFGLVGLLPVVDLGLGWRVLLLAAVGALAGGTAGALYFGGRVPELDGETTEAGGRPGVGTSPRDPRTDARGRPRSG